MSGKKCCGPGEVKQSVSTSQQKLKKKNVCYKTNAKANNKLKKLNTLLQKLHKKVFILQLVFRKFQARRRILKNC